MVNDILLLEQLYCENIKGAPKTLTLRLERDIITNGNISGSEHFGDLEFSIPKYDFKTGYQYYDTLFNSITAAYYKKYSRRLTVTSDDFPGLIMFGHDEDLNIELQMDTIGLEDFLTEDEIEDLEEAGLIEHFGEILTDGNTLSNTQIIDKVCNCIETIASRDLPRSEGNQQWYMCDRWVKYMVKNGIYMNNLPEYKKRQVISNLHIIPELIDDDGYNVGVSISDINIIINKLRLGAMGIGMGNKGRDLEIGDYGNTHTIKKVSSTTPKSSPNITSAPSSTVKYGNNLGNRTLDTSSYKYKILYGSRVM